MKPRLPPNVLYQGRMLRRERQLDLVRARAPNLGGGQAVQFRQWEFALADGQELQLVAQNPQRGYLLICNFGAGILHLAFGKRPAVGYAVPVAPGDNYELIVRVPANTVSGLAQGAVAGIVVEA